MPVSVLTVARVRTQLFAVEDGHETTIPHSLYRRYRAIGLDSGQCPGGVSARKAHVGFGSTVSDREVSSLLVQNGVRAKAAFIWTYGLSGSHRVSDAITGPEMVGQARAETIKFMRDSLKGNERRTSDFLNAHTEEAVSRDEDLQRYARGLLSIRKQLEASLRTAESGHPLLFGVEVEGTQSSLQRLRTVPTVRAFSAISETGDTDARGRARLSVQSVKPKAFQSEYRDPAVLTASSADLYSLLKSNIAAQP